jgi:hypothetical protein
MQWAVNRGPWSLNINNYFTTVMCKLKSIELDLMCFNEHRWCCVDFFVEILAEASKLQLLSLRLGLKEGHARSHCNGQNDVQDVLICMSQLFRCVDTILSFELLKLRETICQESQLLDMVGRPSTHLRYLSLRDLYLVGDRGVQSCLVNLLDHLKICKQGTVDIEGGLWNGGLQRINFDPEGDEAYGKELIKTVKMWLADGQDDTANSLEAMKIRADRRDIWPNHLQRRELALFLLAGGTIDCETSSSLAGGAWSSCILISSFEASSNTDHAETRPLTRSLLGTKK